MTQTLISAALWFLALACGLMAGLYFSFSTFIMTAFGRIEQSQGVAAMNAINATIVRSLVMPLFFGTTLLSLVMSIVALLRWGEPGSPAMLAAGPIYVLGMSVCTMLFNVPLNNALAAADPGGAAAAPLWAR